jgi:hypothetical protein
MGLKMIKARAHRLGVRSGVSRPLTKEYDDETKVVGTWRLNKFSAGTNIREFAH